MDALHSAFRSELHTCSLRRTSLNFINLRIDLRRSPELEQQNRAEYHMFEHTHQKYVHLLMASHFLSLHHASAPPESLKWFGCKIPADCHINAARMIDARSHTLDNRLKKGDRIGVSRPRGSRSGQKGATAIRSTGRLIQLEWPIHFALEPILLPGAGDSSRANWPFSTSTTAARILKLLCKSRVLSPSVRFYVRK